MLIVVEVEVEEKQRGAEVHVETETTAKAGAACKPKELPLVVHVAELKELTCTARGRRRTHVPLITAAEPFADFAEFEAAPAPARRTAAATVAEADRDSMVCKIQTDRIYVVAAIVPQETV